MVVLLGHVRLDDWVKTYLKRYEFLSYLSIFIEYGGKKKNLYFSFIS